MDSVYWFHSIAALHEFAITTQLNTFLVCHGTDPVGHSELGLRLLLAVPVIVIVIFRIVRMFFIVGIMAVLVVVSVADVQVRDSTARQLR